MQLAIYGSGGLGRECADIAKKNNNYDKIIFIDDTKDSGTLIEGIETLTFDDFNNIYDINTNEVIIAVGEPKSREALYDRLKKNNIKIGTLISNNAVLSKNCSLAEGCIVCEFATIHTGAKIGANVLIQPHAVIGHDITIGSNSVLSSFFAPGGGSFFGERVYVGMHAIVKEKLHVGNDAIIGMGSVVYRDVNDGETVVGNPARVTLGNAGHKIFSNK